jgi:hypothetical protein
LAWFEIRFEPGFETWFESSFDASNELSFAESFFPGNALSSDWSNERSIETSSD